MFLSSEKPPDDAGGKVLMRLDSGKGRKNTTARGIGGGGSSLLPSRPCGSVPGQALDAARGHGGCVRGAETGGGSRRRHFEPGLRGTEGARHRGREIRRLRESHALLQGGSRTGARRETLVREIEACG